MSQSTVTPRVLTLKQFADALQFQPTTVRMMINAGQIPGAFKLGNRWRIPASALDQLIGGASPDQS